MDPALKILFFISWIYIELQVYVRQWSPWFWARPLFFLIMMLAFGYTEVLPRNNRLVSLGLLSQPLLNAGFWICPLAAIWFCSFHVFLNNSQHHWRYCSFYLMLLQTRLKQRWLRTSTHSSHRRYHFWLNKQHFPSTPTRLTQYMRVHALIALHPLNVLLLPYLHVDISPLIPPAAIIVKPYLYVLLLWWILWYTAWVRPNIHHSAPYTAQNRPLSEPATRCGRSILRGHKTFRKWELIRRHRPRWIQLWHDCVYRVYKFSPVMIRLRTRHVDVPIDSHMTMPASPDLTYAFQITYTDIPLKLGIFRSKGFFVYGVCRSPWHI